MLLLFAGWPRRIGLGLIALSLLAAVVKSAGHDAGADAGACATASAWQDGVLATDHRIGSALKTAAAAHDAPAYRTAAAEIDRALASVRPAPTIAAPWWAVYAGQMRDFQTSISAAAAGTSVPVDLTAVANAQRTPLAAWGAACR